MTTDNDLIARVLARQDPSAFGELVQRHQGPVRNFLRKLTGELSLSDDLAQDTFLQAWDKLATYRAQGAFVGWLLRIAYTRFLQHRRRAQRYGEILDVIGPQTEHHSDADVSDLDRFMALLSLEERAVMTLCYAVGMSHREVSEVLDMPVGTVKTMILRGKRRIRTHFGVEGHTGRPCRER
ncbi:MAG: RNA polymerase sigma factor [Pseudomonadota bacterium]